MTIVVVMIQQYLIHRSTTLNGNSRRCCYCITNPVGSFHRARAKFRSRFLALPCSCCRLSTNPHCLQQALIACATRLHEVQNSAEFGVELPGPVGVDFGKVMQRMRRIRSDISEVSHSFVCPWKSHLMFCCSHRELILVSSSEANIGLRFRMEIQVLGACNTVLSDAAMCVC